ncbi:MAG: LysR family transcriptional regulator [Bacteriovoracaceae bacterium]
MNLLNRELLILKLLVEEKNITKAAQKAGLQQPALSKILKQLEMKLDRKLFSRTSEGLRASDFTLELMRIAIETESQWQQSINGLLEKETRVEGLFNIGCHSILANAYLAKTYTHLQNKYPQLTLNLMLFPSRVVTEKVVKGEIHFGLVANPVKYPELVTKTIGVDHVYLYANGELERGSVIYFNPEMIDIAKFTSKYKGYKLVPIPDYQLMARLVLESSNQGAILPTCVGMAAGALKIVSKSFYKSDIKLIYRQDLHKSFAVIEILNQLKKLALTKD